MPTEAKTNSGNKGAKPSRENKEVVEHYESDCMIMYGIKSAINGVGKLCGGRETRNPA